MLTGHRRSTQLGTNTVRTKTRNPGLVMDKQLVFQHFLAPYHVSLLATTFEQLDAALERKRNSD